MESGNSSYTQLSVRISVNSKESLIGSGVLYLRNKNQDALIFTAAHVILDNIDDTGTVQLHMHIFDREHESHEISGTFTKSTNETPVRNNTIYVLETYERETLIDDAAIIVIPWEEWMTEFPNMSIIEPEVNSGVCGWGYPQSMSSGESDLESQGAAIAGTVNNNLKRKYHITYKSGIVAGDIASRADEMEGFSGTGLFVLNNKKNIFTGCLSCEAGNDETAGSRAFVTAGRVYIELMKKYNLYPNVPDSFEPYKEMAFSQFDADVDVAYNFFADAIEELIEDKKLVPSKCISDEDDFSDLDCEQIRTICNEFWRGQLTKAVCFCKILGKDISELPQLKVSLNKKGNAVVRIEFICTEMDVRNFIQQLITKYHYKKKDADGLVFLWNDSKSRYYMRSIPRKHIRRIVIDIAGHSGLRYTPREIQKLGKRCELFNIVDGAIETGNIAVIGIGKLLNKVIYEKDGVSEDMLSELTTLLNDVWEDK